MVGLSVQLCVQVPASSIWSLNQLAFLIFAVRQSAVAADVQAPTANFYLQTQILYVSVCHTLLGVDPLMCARYRTPGRYALTPPHGVMPIIGLAMTRHDGSVHGSSV